MLSDLFPPIVGGRERHVQSLSRALARNGHKITVCTIGHQGLPSYEQEYDIKIHRVEGLFQKMPFLFKDPARRLHPPTSDWLLTKKLREILVEEKPDVVHVHGRILYSLLPLKKKFHIRSVVTLHSYEVICPTSGLMNGTVICDKPFTSNCIACGRQSYGMAKSLAAYVGTKVNKKKLKAVDKFIAVSSFVRRVHLKHLGLNNDNIVVISNFYAPEASQEVKTANKLPEDFILFVGALMPIKGVDILIDAYQKLGTRTKLVLIGAKHPAHHYEGTENILVLQNAPYGVVMEAYRNCRFAVFPSIWPDPCPTVAFEAMSHKKAIIASRAGGFTDIVADGETGILVPPHDAQALYQAMNYLLANPKVAEEMGQKGYERWEQNFTPEVVVPQIEELYESLTRD